MRTKQPTPFRIVCYRCATISLFVVHFEEGWRNHDSRQARAVHRIAPIIWFQASLELVGISEILYACVPFLVSVRDLHANFQGRKVIDLLYTTRTSATLGLAYHVKTCNEYLNWARFHRCVRCSEILRWNSAVTRYSISILSSKRLMSTNLWHSEYLRAHALFCVYQCLFFYQWSQ